MADTNIYPMFPPAKPGLSEIKYPMNNVTAARALAKKPQRPENLRQSLAPIGFPQDTVR